MKITRFLFLAILLSGTCLLSTAQTTELPLQLFTYDKTVPFALTDSLVSTQQGVSIHKIRFDSPAGGHVSGLLFLPAGAGPFPGILLQHGAPGTAMAQTPRGVYLARHGAIVLAINAPFAERGGEPIQFTPADSVEQVKHIINLQRAVDLLISRPDIDPNRLGYVGRSYGGATGALLAGVERRLKTYILVVADGGLVSHFSSGKGEPGDQLPVTGEQRTRWLAAMQPIEPIRYIHRAAPASLFMQSARQDEAVSVSSAKAVQQAAPAGKVVKWYETGHRLNAQAYVDQLAWLHDKLGTAAPGPDDQQGPDFSNDPMDPKKASPSVAKLSGVADSLQRYIGSYEIAPGQQMTVSLSDGKLYILPPGETTKAELKRVNDSEFVVAGEEARLFFKSDQTGAVLQVEVRFGNGASATGKKV
jgi:hypothetical protein